MDVDHLTGREWNGSDTDTDDTRFFLRARSLAFQRGEIAKSNVFKSPFEACLKAILTEIPVGQDCAWTKGQFLKFKASVAARMISGFEAVHPDDMIAHIIDHSEAVMLSMLDNSGEYFPSELSDEVKDRLRDGFRAIFEAARLKGQESLDKFRAKRKIVVASIADGQENHAEGGEEADGEEDAGGEKEANDFGQDKDDAASLKADGAPDQGGDGKGDAGLRLLRKICSVSFVEDEQSGRPFAYNQNLNFASHTTRMRNNNSKDPSNYLVSHVGRDVPSGLIGSHSAKSIYDADSIGQAVAVFASTFWTGMTSQGRSIIQLIQDGDDDMIAAIADPCGVGKGSASNHLPTYRKRVEDFFGVKCGQPARSRGHVGEASPQVYWLTSPSGEALNDGRDGRPNDFTLIAPIPPLSLAIDITSRLELMKAASHFLFRDAKDVSNIEYAPDDKKWNSMATKGYLKPGIVYGKVGGSKPQNVSSISSINGAFGYAYLPSLPPLPDLDPEIPAVLRYSAVRFFITLPGIQKILTIRANMLINPNGPNCAMVKAHRSGLEDRILDAIFDVWERYTSVFEAGWSGTDGFEGLSTEEAIWIDPMRGAGMTDSDSDKEYWRLSQSKEWMEPLRRNLACVLAEETMRKTLRNGSPPSHLGPTWIDDDAYAWQKSIRFAKSVPLSFKKIEPSETKPSETSDTDGPAVPAI